MLSALRQVAELARELCRPDFSEVDNALGRYLLETVQPLLSEAATGDSPAPDRPRSKRWRWPRLLWRRRDDGNQRVPVLESGKPLNFADYVPTEAACSAMDSRYKIAEPEIHVSVH